MNPTVVNSTPDPYEQGMAAAARGESNIDNPYKEGTEEYNDWLEGLAGNLEDNDGQ